MRTRVSLCLVALASAGGCSVACSGATDVPDGGGSAWRPPGAADTTRSAPSEPRHASCTLPFPEVAPELPAIDRDAAGRPFFDYWREIPCSTAESSCSAEGALDCSACSHARACCDDLPSVDCRAWPFDGTSAPGMLCAAHADCELGLVCAAPAEGEGYGVCQCPGTSAPAHACGYFFDDR